MPHYYFHHRDGGAIDDDIGLDLPNDEAARQQALRTLPEIARDVIPPQGDKHSLVILVTDQDGRPVYSATLSFAGVRLRPGHQG